MLVVCDAISVISAGRSAVLSAQVVCWRLARRGRPIGRKLRNFNTKLAITRLLQKT